jgi:hypothetical protein
VRHFPQIAAEFICDDLRNLREIKTQITKIKSQTNHKFKTTHSLVIFEISKRSYLKNPLLIIAVDAVRFTLLDTHPFGSLHEVTPAIQFMFISF